MDARSVYGLETIGFICGFVLRAGMLVAAMIQRTSTLQRTFIQLAIQSSNLSSGERTGAGVTSTMSFLRLKSMKPTRQHTKART
jgi:hypothetical protein